MANGITRRQAVIGMSSTLALQAGCSYTPIGPDSDPEAVFAHGVASGDPATDSVVIWTRISGAREPVAVDWYVARDSGMSDVVAHGQYTTGDYRDYTVKPVVDGLDAGRTYFYHFIVNGVTSPLGRTKTLPAGHLEKLVLAVASCSNYPFGWFNAYEVIANDDEVDLVVHLGDYIYEYRALGGYGAETGRRIGRMHVPGTETVTLEDYRQRHGQYKTDPGSRAMHGRHPLVAIWDDHESANNPWMEGAENHEQSEGDWIVRRTASLQAYYEWMPIRDPGLGGSWERYWRHFSFGDLASIVTLESRHTGRSEQITWGGRLDDFADATEAADFYRDVIGAPGRNMLSAENEAFFSDAIAASSAAGQPWRIVGNQSVMARRVLPQLADPFFTELRGELGMFTRGMLDDVTRLGELRLPGDIDAWDGYPDARNRFYGLARDAGATDLLVISGDSHSYWANALYDDDERPMGVELGTTGITSPRSLLSFGTEGLARFDVQMAAQNREVVWTEGRYRGFIRLELTHERAHADFVTVTNVETRDYEQRTVHAVDIERRNGTLEYV